MNMPAEAAAKLAEARNYLRRVGGCALLIGVETYDGLPADKQLLAGRNDVVSYWKVCRRLGYRPTEIRVLTSPALTQDDILRAERDLAPELHAGKSEQQLQQLVGSWFSGDKSEVVLGEATRDAIVEGIKWLAAKLVVTVKLDWGSGKLEEELAALPGLLVYSGHGARVLGDLALCPRDVGSALERALSFAELRALVDAGDDIRSEGTPRPADNLTVVLDCCFASAGSASQGNKASRVSTLTRGEDGATVARTEIGSRVFCASGRDQQAYQAMLGGRWQGAFTWAFTRALEQWKTAPSGQYKKSTVSHIELLFRARMLLEALSFPQHPVLVDRIGNLPVFQHDSDKTDDTSAEPDAERRGIQLDPNGGFNFTEFTLSSSVGPVVVAIVPNGDQMVNGTRWLGGTEYWCVLNGVEVVDTSTGSGWALSVNGGSTPSQLQKDCFTMPSGADWTQNTYTMDLVNNSPVGFNFGLTARLSKTGSGSIMWFNHSKANLFFPNLPWSGDLTAGGSTQYSSFRASNQLP